MTATNSSRRHNNRSQCAEEFGPGVYRPEELTYLKGIFEALTSQNQIAPNSDAGMAIGKQLLRMYRYGVRDPLLLQNLTRN